MILHSKFEHHTRCKLKDNSAEISFEDTILCHAPNPFLLLGLVREVMDHMSSEYQLNSSECQTVSHTMLLALLHMLLACVCRSMIVCCKRLLFLCSHLHPDGAETQLAPNPCQLPAEVSLCGKMEVLDRILVKLIAAGHKVHLQAEANVSSCCNLAFIACAAVAWSHSCHVE